MAMKAIRIRPSSGTKYSASNPAPASALYVDNTSRPRLNAADELLVQVKASTVVRDMLTWPEMLEVEDHIPGSDFSGIVKEVYDIDSDLKEGDEVFGMATFESKRSGTWAEYAMVKRHELAHKPKSLSFEEAASVPLSALTAWQALFHKADVPEPGTQHSGSRARNILITGASGAVGVWLIQLAKLADCHVTALSRNRTKDDLLYRLGADEIADYTLLDEDSTSDTIIDTVGGEALQKAWTTVKAHGVVVSIDSASYDFVTEMQKSGTTREGVRGVWFIVESSGQDLEKISKLLNNGSLQTFVAKTFPFQDVKAAYELASGRDVGTGKVVLTF